MHSQRISCPEIFDFAKTVGHQTHYRELSGADLYTENVYYRVISREDYYLPVAVQESITKGELIVYLPSIYSKEDLGYAARKLSQMLGFSADLSGFYSSVQNDQPFQQITQAFYGLRPSLSESIFEALVTAIIGQQISASVARVIRDLLVDTYGTKISAFSKSLKSFPSPETILKATHEELRSIKLSNRKAEYLQHIALKTLEGDIDDEKLSLLDDEVAIDELVKVRGIGRWTAEWILIRGLGRPDVSPSGDLVLKRAVSEIYDLGKPLSELECARFMREKWSPYRSLATTYLFASLRTKRAMLARDI